MARFPYNNDVPQYEVSRVQLGRDVISGKKLLHQDYWLRAPWPTYCTNYGLQVEDKYLQHLPALCLHLAMRMSFSCPKHAVLSCSVS